MLAQFLQGWSKIVLCACALALSVRTASSQVLSYAQIDDPSPSSQNATAQLSANFTLYWSLYDINQQMQNGRSVDFLLLSGTASSISARLAAVDGVLAHTILLLPTDRAFNGLPAMSSSSEQIKDLSAGGLINKDVQIHLLRLPAGIAHGHRDTAQQIAALPAGSAGTLAFVCSPHSLVDLPKALAGKPGLTDWEALYFFHNCLALWRSPNQAKAMRSKLALQQWPTAGYRMVALTVNGSVAMVDRDRPEDAPKKELSADKIGDLMLAEALEQHCRLQESEEKYRLALTSTDEAVRSRALSGIHRVLHWRNLWKWLFPLTLFVMLVLMLTAANIGLKRKRGRLVLRVESLGDSGAMLNFAMHVQRQERTLAEIVGESFLTSTGDAGRTVFAPPPSQILNLGALPSLSIAKVDVKSVLTWLVALREYFGTRRLVVWIGKLSRRTIVRAAIESGWTTQIDYSFEAETEEEAAWQLVTWSAGYDVTR